MVAAFGAHTKRQAAAAQNMTGRFFQQACGYCFYSIHSGLAGSGAKAARQKRWTLEYVQAFIKKYSLLWMSNILLLSVKEATQHTCFLSNKDHLRSLL